MTSATGRPASASVMQFSVRAVMVAVSASALACALAAPFVRSMSPEVQARTAALIVAAAFGALLFTATMCWRRLCVERRAGAVILAAPMLSLRSVSAMLIGSLIQSALMLWIARNGILTGTSLWAFAIGIVVGVAAGFYVTMSLLYLWWRRAMVSLVLCENGIILNALRFIAWDSLAGSHWSFDRGYLCWAARTYYMNGFQLPPEMRDEADRIMHEYIPNARMPAREAPSRSAASGA
jgi:hypothetical protein